MSDKTKNLRRNVPDDLAQLLSAIFGESNKVELWLNTPIRALNGDTPVARLNTDDGIDEVKTILCKIESGEFS